MTEPAETLDAQRATAFVANVLKSQYHAGLAMLREAIELCPDDLWLDPTPRNAYWRIAYHTLFFLHAYTSRGIDSFERWPEHQRDNQNEDGILGPPDPESTLPLGPQPYTREHALRYADWIDARLDAAVDALDLRSRDSGFPRYPMPKLEHQLVNLRHLQHHTAQLADRLRAARDVGVRWHGRGRAAQAPQS